MQDSCHQRHRRSRKTGASNVLLRVPAIYSQSTCCERGPLAPHSQTGRGYVSSQRRRNL